MMSIEDKIPNGDIVFVDRAHTSLLSLAEQVSCVWQDYFSSSVRDLRQKLYGVAAASRYVIAAHNREPATLFLAGMFTLSGFFPQTHLQTQFEMQNEAFFGMSPRTSRAINFIPIVFGILDAGIGSGLMMYGILYDDPSSITTATPFALRAISDLSYMGAHYLSEYDSGDPPRRPRKKGLFERLKEKFAELVPYSSPLPIPVRTHATGEFG